jgi:hypothetical protein
VTPTAAHRQPLTTAARGAADGSLRQGLLAIEDEYAIKRYTHVLDMAAGTG